MLGGVGLVIWWWASWAVHGWCMGAVHGWCMGAVHGWCMASVHGCSMTWCLDGFVGLVGVGPEHWGLVVDEVW